MASGQALKLDGLFDGAKLRLQIQYGKQAAKANKLTDHHAKFQNLGVSVVKLQPVKKGVIHVLVVSGHQVGIFQCELFRFGKCR
jgi:hypothetical protein